MPEWLCQKLDCSRLDGFDRHGNVAMSGYKDDRNRPARRTQLTLKVQAANARKAYVQDQTTGAVRMLAAEELFRRRVGLGLQPHGLQQIRDGLTHTFIIINDEHHRGVRGGHESAADLAGRGKTSLSLDTAPGRRCLASLCAFSSQANPGNRNCMRSVRPVVPFLPDWCFAFPRREIKSRHA